MACKVRSHMYSYVQRQSVHIHVLLLLLTDVCALGTIADASSNSASRNDMAAAPSAAAVTWPSDLAKIVHKRMKSFPRNYEAKELAVEAGLNAAEWSIAATAFRKAFLKSPDKFFRDQEELLHFAKVRASGLIVR